MLSTSKKQGALKRAMGGAIRRTVGRAAASAAGTSPPPPKATGLRGALGRALSRVAPQGQKNPQPRKGNHMVRNAGPIKPETLSSTDSTLAETGDGLRKIVGRMNTRGRVAASKGGKIKSAVRSLRALNDRIGGDRNVERSIVRKQEKLQRDLKRRGVDYEGDEDNIGTITRRPVKLRKYAEGGKVGTAMSALKALAKKYQAALDSGDTLLARRLKRQLDAAGFKDLEEKVGNEKAATFAKGGKVSAVSKVAARLLESLKRLDIDPDEFDLYDEKGNLRIEEAKEIIEDAIEGEREVDDFTESLGTTDPQEVTKKIQQKVRGK